MKRISRRNFLKAMGISATALTLAACGGSSSSTAASTAGSSAASAAATGEPKAGGTLRLCYGNPIATNPLLPSKNVLDLIIRKHDRPRYPPFSRGFAVRRCTEGMFVDLVTQETRLHPGDAVLAINRTAPKRIVQNLPNPLLAADVPEREQWNGYLKLARDITVRHADGTEETLELARYPVEGDAAPSVQELGTGTLLLNPGTLNDAVVLEAFVQAHQAQLDGCTQLVIDLRTTRGEDEEALLPLLPYIAAEDTTAGEIFGDRRIRTNYTKMNCTRLIRMLKPYLVDEDPALRQMAQQWTSYYRNQSGKGWVDEVEALPVPAEMPILHRGPEKVVLLTDTWCEQEAEHFVQLAKQQGRAVLLGRPTMGTLDYTNPVTVLYDAFSFTYPISRTMASLEGNGVDERGVQPDVVVPWTAAECIRDLLAEKAQTL